MLCPCDASDHSSDTSLTFCWGATAPSTTQLIQPCRQSLTSDGAADGQQPQSRGQQLLQGRPVPEGRRRVTHALMVPSCWMPHLAAMSCPPQPCGMMQVHTREP